jgi:HlyD family secretion protein
MKIARLKQDIEPVNSTILENKISDTSGQDVFVGSRSNRARNIKRLLAVVFIVALTLLGYDYLKGFIVADNFFERSKLRTAIVERGDYERSISVEGNVVAAFRPTLYAQDTGEVYLKVQEGDIVRKDQLLATIDNPALVSQLKREQAALKLANVEAETLRNQLAQREVEASQTLTLLQINLDAERREFIRMSKIENKSSISINDLEKIKDRVHAFEVQVENTKQLNQLVRENHKFELQTKSLAIDQQALLADDLARQVNALSMVSPVDGVVGNIEVREQDTVARKQALLNVVDLSSYEIEVRIPETYAESLNKGLPVRVSYRSQDHIAELASISPQVTNGSVTARVVFTGEAPSGLRENLRLNNKIILESKSNVLKVKRGPFVESHGGHGVYVMRDEEIARYTRIAVGSVGINEIELLRGVKEGDELIISNTSELLGADTVLITN